MSPAPYSLGCLVDVFSATQMDIAYELYHLEVTFPGTENGHVGLGWTSPQARSVQEEAQRRGQTRATNWDTNPVAGSCRGSTSRPSTAEACRQTRPRGVPVGGELLDGDQRVPKVDVASDPGLVVCVDDRDAGLLVRLAGGHRSPNRTELGDGAPRTLEQYFRELAEQSTRTGEVSR